MYTKIIRPLLRQALAKTCSGKKSSKQVIAVVGLPRSGTSWLAKAISLSEKSLYYFEPEHNLGSEYWYKFLPEGRNDSLLYNHISNTLKGKIFDEYTICEQGFKDIIFQHNIKNFVLKWVRFSLCLDWIGREFPNIKIVQIIRHPVPQFLSWAERGWTPEYNLKLLLNQTELMDTHLKPFLHTIQNSAGFWEQAGVFWGAVATLQLHSHRPGWFLIEHEWLCLDPEKRIRWLMDELEIPWNEKVADFLSPKRKKVTGPGYGKARDSRKEVHKWKNSIDQKDIETLSKTLKAFNLPFYSDLNPEKFVFMDRTV